MSSDSSGSTPIMDQEFIKFPSRRSVVHSTDGMIACTQPLAARVGLSILAQGGNAADAAVAVAHPPYVYTAAALNLTEPSSTGIGGDMFCLYYDAKTRKISALNGSERSGMNCNLDRIRNDLGMKDGETGKIPMTSVHAVTVRGGPAAWVDTIEKFGSGKLSLEQILAPAVELGEKGFPVHEISSRLWRLNEEVLRKASPNFHEMLKPDPSAVGGFRAPKPGEIFKNPTLANTFRTLGKEGKKGFYTGRVQNANGLEVWEQPPSGQGIVALMVLGILEELERTEKIPRFGESDHNSASYIHAVVEALRIAFADASWWVTDPNTVTVPTNELISENYLAERAKLFDPAKASSSEVLFDRGSPAHNHCDTVYFAVTDAAGNGISFISSN